MKRPHLWAMPSACVLPPRSIAFLIAILLVSPLGLALVGGQAFAHAVAEGDKGYIQ